MRKPSRMVRDIINREAKGDGYKAGLEGEPAKVCPYVRGDDELLPWLAGWVEGDKERNKDEGRS